jgi:two-component system response regulator MprA
VEGTRFVVRLPAAAGERLPLMARPSGPAPVPAGSLRTIRVLLVDDELAVRSPIARFLSRRGADVREASDGLEALDILATTPVDVIVADLRMPRMDGAALCAELARRRPDQLARVILLSGDLSQLQGILPVPAERVLAKPVELTEIEAAIRKVAAAAA